MSFPRPPALLPAGLRDLLAPEARLEAHVLWTIGRVVAGHGYEPVKPPLVEFEETLLSGSGQSMARQTFRLMDPLSQHMMAVRADMTMQIARIATSRLANQPRPLRLTYSGEVLRVAGEDQLRPERQFCQVGCELIGSESQAADTEIILLAVECLEALGIAGVSVDINLPNLVPGLLKAHSYPPHEADELAAAIERRDLTRVRHLGRDISAMVERLVAAAGPVAPALEALAGAGLPDGMKGDLDRLERTLRLVRREAPGLAVTIDPIERRGFEYQYALSFTLFVAGVGEVGRGGRYRAGGHEDGEPATGFTLMTETLLRAVPALPPPPKVYLPPGTAPEDAAALRRQGCVTLRGLAEGDPAAEAARQGCAHYWEGGLKPGG